VTIRRLEGVSAGLTRLGEQVGHGEAIHSLGSARNRPWQRGADEGVTVMCSVKRYRGGVRTEAR
jgi:hypothetical protein